MNSLQELLKKTRQRVKELDFPEAYAAETKAAEIPIMPPVSAEAAASRIATSPKMDAYVKALETARPVGSPATPEEIATLPMLPSADVLKKLSDSYPPDNTPWDQVPIIGDMEEYKRIKAEEAARDSARPKNYTPPLTDPDTAAKMADLLKPAIRTAIPLVKELVATKDPKKLSELSAKLNAVPNLQSSTVQEMVQVFSELNKKGMNLELGSKSYSAPFASKTQAEEAMQAAQALKDAMPGSPKDQATQDLMKNLGSYFQTQYQNAPSDRIKDFAGIADAIREPLLNYTPGQPYKESQLAEGMKDLKTKSDIWKEKLGMDLKTWETLNKAKDPYMELLKLLKLPPTIQGTAKVETPAPPPQPRAGIEEYQLKNIDKASMKLRQDITKEDTGQQQLFKLLNTAIQNGSPQAISEVKTLIARNIGAEKGALSEGDVTRALAPWLGDDAAKYASYLFGPSTSKVSVETRNRLVGRMNASRQATKQKSFERLRTFDEESSAVPGYAGSSLQKSVQVLLNKYTPKATPSAPAPTTLKVGDIKEVNGRKYRYQGPKDWKLVQ